MSLVDSFLGGTLYGLDLNNKSSKYFISKITAFDYDSLFVCKAFSDDTIILCVYSEESKTIMQQKANLENQSFEQEEVFFSYPFDSSQNDSIVKATDFVVLGGDLGELALGAAYITPDNYIEIWTGLFSYNKLKPLNTMKTNIKNTRTQTMNILAFTDFFW